MYTWSLILAFTLGEPVKVEMDSLHACHEAVASALVGTPHLVDAHCAAKTTEWRRYL